MKIRTMKFGTGMFALALLAGACTSETTSDDDTAATTVTTVAGAETTAVAATTAPSDTTDETTADTDGPTTTAGSTTTAGAATTVAGGGGPTDAELVQWALDYTGGTAGAAGSDTFKVGYVNQEDFFPENTIGVEAAAAFIDAELGGFAGKSLELVPCTISTPEDGAKCGAQFANDDTIQLVLTGTILNGNKELYEALNGKKAVVIGNGLTTDDFLTTAGQAFTAGSPGTIPGLAQFVLQYITPKVTKVAVLASNNPAGQAAYGVLFNPVMKAAGIETTYVPIDDTATATDVQTAMTNVGAGDADVFVPLVTIQQCINVYDAIQALDIDPTVVTSGLCFGTPMTDHLKEAGESGPVPDGWYFAGYGYSYFRPDLESGMATYVAKVQQYGKPAPGASTLEYTGFAGPSFANVMTVAKFANELGPDQLDYASLNEKIRGFTGPQMLQVGPLACGKQVIVNIPFPAVCASQVGVQRYADGVWTSEADALNGQPIDVSKVVV